MKDKLIYEEMIPLDEAKRELEEAKREMEDRLKANVIW
jgi:hypothetical protein